MTMDKLLRCPNCGSLAGTGTPLRTEEEIQRELHSAEDFATPGPLNQARPADLEQAFRSATAHLPQLPVSKVSDCMFMARIRRDEEDARITLSH